MASPPECYVTQLTKPVQLHYKCEKNRWSYDCYTGDELRSRLTDNHDEDYHCLLISICQRNSWQPLQITKKMLDCIFSQYGIDPAIFGELPSLFYRRNLAVEEAFCIPYTQWIRGTCIAISYTIRYPEFKESSKEWIIRQTGLLHHLDVSTQKTLYLLFNPMSDSKAHESAMRFMDSDSDPSHGQNPFWLHETVFSAYLPAWRQYIAAYEREFLKLRNLTFSTFIDKPLPVGYDNLSALASLENRFLQMPILLAQEIETLEGLHSLLNAESNGKLACVTEEVLEQLSSLLEWHINRLGSYNRSAEYIHQRTQSTTQLLASTLSLRDQVVAKDQTTSMLRLNKSVVFITILTLFYLPASFLSSFFGMSFFSLNEENGQFIASEMIWIYIVSATALTAGTLLLYNNLLKRDEKLSSPDSTTDQSISNRWEIRGALKV
ncbi:hypothetical protein B0I35DRAFT_445457 [Stachybotrys elegans]|uniref:Uncharacterized protein n=1 Tax=Stachybotrys elegans TaxID=80388 RepID=A0A8K0SEJ8_9HYPO|nr:hypothetical protein B0I35DRAFT_445457 [Stachybotrys elegans]